MELAGKMILNIRCKNLERGWHDHFQGYVPPHIRRTQTEDGVLRKIFGYRRNEVTEAGGAP
jgi:hypothetical protein